MSEHDCESAIEKLRPGFLFSGSRQDGERTMCPKCGAVFEHVCDEADGCSWSLVSAGMTAALKAAGEAKP